MNFISTKLVHTDVKIQP